MYSSCASIRAGASAGWNEPQQGHERSATGAARAMLNNLGLAHGVLGETRRAIEHYEQSLSIMREIGDRLVEGTTLGNLGVAYKDLGETHRANRALRAEPRDRGGDRRPARRGQCARQSRRPKQRPVSRRFCPRGSPLTSANKKPLSCSMLS